MLLQGCESTGQGGSRPEAMGAWTITANIIAKTPNGMNSNIRYRYSLAGDTLSLTLNSAWAPEDGEIAYRLRRLE